MSSAIAAPTGLAAKPTILAALEAEVDLGHQRAQNATWSRVEIMESLAHRDELVLTALRKCECPAFWERAGEYLVPRRLLVACPCSACGALVHAGKVPLQVRAWGTVLCDGCAPLVEAGDSGEEAGR